MVGTWWPVQVTIAVGFCFAESCRSQSVIPRRRNPSVLWVLVPYISASRVQVVALVRGSDLWVANAGDSRCVASRRGRALALTHDHKPTDSGELQRIAKVGSMPARRPVESSLPPLSQTALPQKVSAQDPTPQGTPRPH